MVPVDKINNAKYPNNNGVKFVFTATASIRFVCLPYDPEDLCLLFCQFFQEFPDSQPLRLSLEDLVNLAFRVVPKNLYLDIVLPYRLRLANMFTR